MQTLAYRFEEAAPDEECFKEHFSWIVLPEFHLTLPLVASCYMPETRRFKAIIDLSQNQWVPPIRFIEAPKYSRSDDMKKTMDTTVAAIYDDPAVQGTFWLLPEQKIKGDGLPQRWIQFSGQYLAGLTYLEPGRTIRRDSTLEAACEIVTTSPITKWGNWAQNNATKLTPATTPSFGKIVCDLATIFGYAAVDAVKNWNKKEQESRALSARQGSFYSYVPYRVLFDQIAYQLSEPIGKHAFSIAVDRQLMQMSASVAWHDYGSEELSGMPQRLDLKLRFVPGQSGTRIDYEWLHYYQVAPGAAANQLVSITNGWIKHIALGAPPR